MRTKVTEQHVADKIAELRQRVEDLTASDDASGAVYLFLNTAERQLRGAVEHIAYERELAEGQLA